MRGFIQSNRETCAEIEAELRRLAEGGRPQIPTAGICSNMVATLSGEGIAGLSAKRGRLSMWLWADWPHFTGDDMYPVPHPEVTPRDAYNMRESLWEGEYGEMRRDLARAMADKIHTVLYPPGP